MIAIKYLKNDIKMQMVKTKEGRLVAVAVYDPVIRLWSFFYCKWKISHNHFSLNQERLRELSKFHIVKILPGVLSAAAVLAKKQAHCSSDCCLFFWQKNSLKTWFFCININIKYFLFFYFNLCSHNKLKNKGKLEINNIS